MFKNGDKIICIKHLECNGYPKELAILDKTYIIDTIIENTGYVLLKNCKVALPLDIFISLEQYRKLKIKKLFRNIISSSLN